MDAVARALERADARACAELIRAGSKSFHAAGLLLPARMRQGAHAIYAFCRLSDDAADDLGGDRIAALSRLSARLDAIYRGRPDDHPVDRALCRTIARHDLPRAAFDGLLEGLGWDQTARTYETLADLHAYAARVAGTVGILMAALMDVRDSARLARACDLGVAMQLTNIARDVGEDAANGRLYLPRAWLREEDIDPQAWLTAPAFTPSLARVIQRLLAAADGLYKRADTGIARLPRACRPAIGAARLIYARIGEQLAVQGYDSISTRTVVPKGRKLMLLAQAAARALLDPMRDADGPLLAPALGATRWLVNAAERADAALPESLPPWAAADRKVEWVLDLCHTLNQRDRSSAAARMVRPA
jgi:15-cis-phytoene synthase